CLRLAIAAITCAAPCSCTNSSTIPWASASRGGSSPDSTAQAIYSRSCSPSRAPHEQKGEPSTCPHRYQQSLSLPLDPLSGPRTRPDHQQINSPALSTQEDQSGHH